jgi:hypothetical protein
MNSAYNDAEFWIELSQTALYIRWIDELKFSLNQQ